MLPSSVLYATALARPHRRIARVTSRTPDGTVLAENIPVLDGSVSAKIASRVTRTASFDLAYEWFPVAATDPLSPAHAIVTIEAGISYPNGDEELFPVFTGRVYAADLDATGRVSFRADDLAADVLGVGVGAWTALPAGAKGDVFVTVQGSGGNGVTAAVLAFLAIQVRNLSL